MPDDDGPKLTLAVSNDDRDFAKRALRNDIYWPTKELMANMLRVARGAGKPEKLIEQFTQLAWTLSEVRDVAAPWEVLGEIEAALHSVFKEKPANQALEHARNAIVSGALQVAASRLVEQYPQECVGQREMDQGMRAIEAVREANRQKWLASTPPEPKTRPPRAKARKRVAPTKKSIPASIPDSVEAQPEPAATPRSTADYMRINAKRRREGKDPI